MEHPWYVKEVEQSFGYSSRLMFCGLCHVCSFVFNVFMCMHGVSKWLCRLCTCFCSLI